MRLLNLMGWLCIFCFLAAGAMTLWLLIELWNRERTEILVILGLVAVGWVLKELVSRREEKVKRQQELENQRLREEYHRESGKEP